MYEDLSKMYRGLKSKKEVSKKSIRSMKGIISCVELLEELKDETREKPRTGEKRGTHVLKTPKSE